MATLIVTSCTACLLADDAVAAEAASATPVRASTLATPKAADLHISVCLLFIIWYLLISRGKLGVRETIWVTAAWVYRSPLGLPWAATSSSTRVVISSRVSCD